MKQRIITAVIAAALFIPFVIYGQLPFTILIYAMAAVGLFEVLKMRGISLFSVPGIISLLSLFIILMPNSWSEQIQDITKYSRIEYLFICAILLLIHTVLVKNKFTRRRSAAGRAYLQHRENVQQGCWNEARG